MGPVELGMNISFCEVYELQGCEGDGLATFYSSNTLLAVFEIRGIECPTKDG